MQGISSVPVMKEKGSPAHYELLGLQAECTAEELEQAYEQKLSALGKTSQGQAREELRLAYNRIAATQRAAAIKARTAAAGGVQTGVKPLATRPAPPAPLPLEIREGSPHPLLDFDNWKVNVIIPPLLLGIVWLVNHSPLDFFLKGFHIWMHEFGHATAAWMCGRRATPLPIGWTPVEPEYSAFVYFGLLLMFGVLFVAGWKERKAWPMIAAVALAGLQYYMTWQMTELQQEFWWSAFGGVGGSFYLSALMMAFFFVELPDKFRWGGCRYVFFLIGATAFLDSTGFWNDVFHGRQEIPFGSMINGEDDQNGDMNKLMAVYHWRDADIRNNFLALGHGCWIGLGMVYGTFVLQLNRIPDKIMTWRNDQDLSSEKA